VRRVRWFEPDDPSTPIDWRVAAAILAPLFLNFTFWLDVGGRFWMVWPLPSYVILTAATALLGTALSALGPWFAVSRTRSLSASIEVSLGAAPALLMRWICMAFAGFWLAAAMSVPVRLWYFFLPATPVWQVYGLTVLSAAFLWHTGIQKLATEARLGFFTSKLGLALLVAALWRVRDGWPAIPAGFENASGPVLWHGLSELAGYLVPLGLFAGDLAVRIPRRRGVVLAATAGIALPLFVSVLLTGIVAIATARSSRYQPSLDPTVAMALFSKTASSALPGRWAIGAITVFGLGRFCIRAMSSAAPTRSAKWRRASLALFCAGACWVSIHWYVTSVRLTLNVLANCLAVMSAIITADWLLRHRATSRRIDWSGCAAFAVGLLAMLVPHDSWQPWLLPCYAAAFVACLVGRMLERAIDPQLLQLLHRD
jgi:hypothetical protein